MNLAENLADSATETESISPILAQLADSLLSSANKRLSDCYATEEEWDLTARMIKLAGLTHDPDAFMIFQEGKVIAVAPNFTPNLFERYIHKPQPAFIAFEDGEELVMASPDGNQGWQYSAIPSDVSNEEALAMAKLAILQIATPANPRVLAVCQQATQHFQAHL